MKPAAEEFERLALEQLDTVYRVARRLARDPARAEDLVQETYLRALKARDSFNLQEYGIRPWLLRILYNLHLSRAEREGRQPVGIEEEHLAQTPAKPEGAPPVYPGNFEGMDEELARAIEGLPEEYATVLLLWAVEDLSYKEIAQALGIPIGTVMSRLHRARQKLAEELREYALAQRIIKE